MRFRNLVIALVFAAATASDSWGQSKQPSPKASEQNSTQQERGTDNSPIVVKVLPSEKTKDDLAREYTKDKKKLEIDERLASLTGDLALYTKLLFIATAVLALITLGLVRASFLQVRDAKRSVAAAETAAKAAQAAAEHIPRVERAYIFIDPRMDAGDYGSRVRYSVFNHGKTPAVILGVGVWLQFKATPPDNSQHFPIKPLLDQYVFPPSPLDPWNDDEHIDYSEDRSLQAAFIKGETFLWFWGSIRYGDVFGNEHFTHFRWKFDYPSQRWAADGEPPHNQRT